MMLLLLWLFCGGLLGFVAALAIGIDRRPGVLVGSVAAAVGGALFSVFGLAGDGLSHAITRSSSTNLVLALVVGVVVVASWQLIVRARS